MSFHVFKLLDTQWNIGPNRAIGLRYESFPVVLQMSGVALKDQARILHDLRVMEQEALTIFNKTS